MDPKSFTLLIILSVSVHSSVGDETSSVFFLDNPSHHYFRDASSKRKYILNYWRDEVLCLNSSGDKKKQGIYSHLSKSWWIVMLAWYLLQVGSGRHPVELIKISSMSLPEVGATVSVLLGFAPPVTLSASSSLKLNEVLSPNPFDRPRSVLLLEVTGAEGVSVEALRSNIISEDRAEIQLPDANEVSLFSLDEQKANAEYSDKELSDFASWLSGSYVNEELTIPLEDDSYLKFQLSKEADREFVTSLILFTREILRATEMHQDLAGALRRPSELITGKFNGLKALKEHYGAEGVAKGTKLFSIVLSKTFDSLSEAYKGEIVGVIVCNGTPSGAESLFNVFFTSKPSARWLEEFQALPNATIIEEIILVRRTVAWITGILLIISTLLGIYFLFYMPITRDTLLYSNVKLD